MLASWVNEKPLWPVCTLSKALMNSASVVLRNLEENTQVLMETFHSALVVSVGVFSFC